MIDERFGQPELAIGLAGFLSSSSVRANYQTHEFPGFLFE
jgi:hypothetical protein